MEHLKNLYTHFAGPPATPKPALKSGFSPDSPLAALSEPEQERAYAAAYQRRTPPTETLDDDVAWHPDDVGVPAGTFELARSADVYVRPLRDGEWGERFFIEGRTKASEYNFLYDSAHTADYLVPGSEDEFSPEVQAVLDTLRVDYEEYGRSKGIKLLPNNPRYECRWVARCKGHYFKKKGFASCNATVKCMKRRGADIIDFFPSVRASVPRRASGKPVLSGIR